MAFKINMTEAAQFSTVSVAEHKQAMALRGTIALRTTREALTRRQRLQRDLMAGAVTFAVIFAAGLAAAALGLI